MSSWLLEKHVRFWSFLWSSCEQRHLSAAELLAGCLYRTNMTACEAIKCKDIPVLETSLQIMREKVPESFKQIVKEAEKLDIEPPIVPRWRRLPRRIDNGSGTTRFTPPQQCLTTQRT